MKPWQMKPDKMYTRPDTTRALGEKYVFMKLGEVLH